MVREIETVRSHHRHRRHSSDGDSGQWSSQSEVAEECPRFGSFRNYRVCVIDPAAILDVENDVSARGSSETDDTVIGSVIVATEQSAGPIIDIAIEVSIAVAIDHNLTVTWARPDIPTVSCEGQNAAGADEL